MTTRTRFLIIGLMGLFLFGCKEVDLQPGQKDEASPNADENGKSNSTSRGGGLTYVTIPSRPALGTNATLTYSSPGNILNSSGGTTQDKILSGAWTQVRLFSFTGDATNHRRISNENGSTVIGSPATSNHVIAHAGTGTTYYEINGKSPSEPFYVTNTGTVPTSTVQVSGQASGPFSWFTNIVGDEAGYGYFGNTSGTLSGGNSTTPPVSTINYQTQHISFLRSFDCGTEWIYAGTTTKTAYGIHHDFEVTNSLGYNMPWDGLQNNNGIDSYFSNLTVVNAGLDNQAGQNQLWQFQNTSGICENSIFMDAPNAGMFATFDFVFRNNFVRWTGNIGIQVLDYFLNYNTSSRLMPDPTGLEILIEDCDFVATTYTGGLLDVSDSEVNITVRNCRIQGPTTLFDDLRGGSPTGTLTDGGGNTFVSSGTIEIPSFTNFTPTDFENHGLLDENDPDAVYHYDLGRGYRTPAP